MVHAMTTWAREQHLTEGNLTILTIDPPPAAGQSGQQPHHGAAQTCGLVFSTIRLGRC